MNWFNHHTHSAFCDGTGTPLDFVKAALAQDFSMLGFSSHAPLPFNNSFTLKEEEVDHYRQTIRSLSYEYAGRLEIYLAMEVDFIPGMIEDFRFWKNRANLDYVIGGVHLVRPQADERLWFIDGPKRETYDQGLSELFGNDIRLAVRSYFDQLNQMIEGQAPDVIAHIDKIKMHNQERFFSINDLWYQAMLNESLTLAKQKGCIVEVNTRGLYKGRCKDFFPGASVLKTIKELAIPITISSDAHAPAELSGKFSEAIEAIKAAGIRELKVFRYGTWNSVVVE
ncbi:MAG: histidinol-phosphatase [Bacteroidales bacterium]|nr:histidinol-phosphatase [Bacteroidales bacterium]MDZ4203304.1 histidinol-phosphatase [Bacteroidales bacterium]